MSNPIEEYLKSVRSSVIDESFPDIDKFMDALMAQESGGVATAKNKRTGAYGLFQILPSNWGPWSKEVFGEVVEKTPENQQKVARAKIEEYFRKFKTPEAVAAAWYAGPDDGLRWLRNPNDEKFDRKPAPGEPSIREYVNSVVGRMKSVVEDETIRTIPLPVGSQLIDVPEDQVGKLLALYQQKSGNPIEEYLATVKPPEPQGFWSYVGNTAYNIALLYAAKFSPDIWDEVFIRKLPGGNAMLKALEDRDPDFNKALDIVANDLKNIFPAITQKLDKTLEYLKTSSGGFVNAVVNNPVQTAGQILKAFVEPIGQAFEVYEGFTLNEIGEYEILTPEQRAQRLKNVMGFAAAIGTGTALSRSVPGGVVAAGVRGVAQGLKAGSLSRAAIAQVAARPHYTVGTYIKSGIFGRELLRKTAISGISGAAYGGVAFAGQDEMLPEIILNGIIFAPLGSAFELIGVRKEIKSLNDARHLAKVAQLKNFISDLQNNTIGGVLSDLKSIASADDILSGVIDGRFNVDPDAILYFDKSNLSPDIAERFKLEGSIIVDDKTPGDPKAFVGPNGEVAVFGKNATVKLNNILESYGIHLDNATQYFRKTGFLPNQRIYINGAEFIVEPISTPLTKADTKRVRLRDTQTWEARDFSVEAVKQVMDASVNGNPVETFGFIRSPQNLKGNIVSKLKSTGHWRHASDFYETHGVTELIDQIFDQKELMANAETGKPITFIAFRQEPPYGGTLGGTGRFFSAYATTASRYGGYTLGRLFTRRDSKGRIIWTAWGNDPAKLMKIYERLWDHFTIKRVTLKNPLVIPGEMGAQGNFIAWLKKNHPIRYANEIKLLESARRIGRGEKGYVHQDLIIRRIVRDELGHDGLIYTKGDEVVDYTGVDRPKAPTEIETVGVTPESVQSFLDRLYTDFQNQLLDKFSVSTSRVKTRLRKLLDDLNKKHGEQVVTYFANRTVSQLEKDVKFYRDMIASSEAEVYSLRKEFGEEKGIVEQAVKATVRKAEKQLSELKEQLEIINDVLEYKKTASAIETAGKTPDRQFVDYLMKKYYGYRITTPQKLLTLLRASTSRLKDLRKQFTDELEKARVNLTKLENLKSPTAYDEQVIKNLRSEVRHNTSAISELSDIIDYKEGRFVPPEEVADLANAVPRPDFNFIQEFNAWARSIGLLPEEIPYIRKQFQERMRRALLSNLDPEDMFVIRKAEAMAAEQIETIRQNDARTVARKASKLGYWTEIEDGGSVTIRDAEGNRVASGIKTLADAHKFLQDLGQTFEFSLDDGNIPPDVFAGDLAEPPDFTPDDFAGLLKNGRMEKLIDTFNLTVFGQFTTRYRELAIALDNKLGTRMFSGIFEPLQQARLRANATLLPWYEQLKNLDTIASKLSSAEREAVLDFFNARDEASLISQKAPDYDNGFQGRNLNENEITVARVLAQSGVDLGNVMKYIRLLNELRKSNSPPEVVAAHIERYRQGLGIDRKHNAIAKYIEGIINGEKGAPQNVNIAAALRLARSILNGESKKNIQLNGAQKALHDQLRKYLERYNRTQGYPDGFNVLDLYYHAKLYYNGNLHAALKDFKGLPSYNYLERLVETGGVSPWVRDPVQFLQQYTKNSVDSQHFKRHLDEAREVLGQELEKLMRGRVTPDIESGTISKPPTAEQIRFMPRLPGIVHTARKIMSRYIEDIAGIPDSDRLAADEIVSQMSSELGLHLSIDTRKHIVNSILSTGEAAAQGFRIGAALRDLAGGIIVMLGNYGVKRTARILRLGAKAIAEGTDDLLKMDGVLPETTVVQFADPTEFAGQMLGRGGRIAKSIGKFNEAAFRLSFQKDIYSLLHAGNYLDTFTRVGENVRNFRDGKISIEQFRENLQLDTYEQPVIARFLELLEQNKDQEAARFLGMQAGQNMVGVYGLANHPFGWNTNFGRLAGQFGQWSMWFRMSLLRMASRGTWAQRAARVSRFLAAQKIMTGVGAAFGFNLTRWQPTTGFVFGGGPAIDLYQALSDAGSGIGFLEEEGKRKLSNFVFGFGVQSPIGPGGQLQPPITMPTRFGPSLLLPGSFFLNDVLRAYEMSQTGDPRLIGRMLGVPVTQD